ncbi:MAG: stage II sporulation protein M [Candidatus Methanomethylicia archaeon]
MKSKIFWICITISTMVFTFGIISGLKQTSIPPLGEEILNPIRELAKQYKPFTISTFMLIFSKNLIALLTMWISGLLLSIPTIVSLWMNGYIIGLVVNLSGNITLAILGILPHGVIEIPALIIAGASGIRIGIEVTRKLASIITHKNASIRRALKETIKPMMISIILLIPAALIETYITPLIMMLFK